jgi:hypothetical protein
VRAKGASQDDSHFSVKEYNGDLSTTIMSPDSAELQPFARLTNQREANKIGFAMQAGATGINAADNMRACYCGGRHNGKMIFEGETVFGACSKTVLRFQEGDSGWIVCFVLYQR